MVGILVEDIFFETVQADIKDALVQLAPAHHFSLSRYPSSFLVVVEMLSSPFHHDILIYKIYNTV